MALVILGGLALRESHLPKSAVAQGYRECGFLFFLCRKALQQTHILPARQQPPVPRPHSALAAFSIEEILEAQDSLCTFFRESTSFNKNTTPYYFLKYNVAFGVVQSEKTKMISTVLQTLTFSICFLSHSDVSDVWNCGALMSAFYAKTCGFDILSRTLWFSVDKYRSFQKLLKSLCASKTN